MCVSNSGGSINLATDSINTKNAITIRKSALINPERISIRPYLKTKKRKMTNGLKKCKHYGFVNEETSQMQLFFFFASSSTFQFEQLENKSWMYYFTAGCTKYLVQKGIQLFIQWNHLLQGDFHIYKLHILNILLNSEDGSDLAYSTVSKDCPLLLWIMFLHAMTFISPFSCRISWSQACNGAVKDPALQQLGDRKQEGDTVRKRGGGLNPYTCRPVMWQNKTPTFI